MRKLFEGGVNFRTLACGVNSKARRNIYGMDGAGSVVLVEEKAAASRCLTNIASHVGEYLPLTCMGEGVSMIK